MNQIIQIIGTKTGRSNHRANKPDDIPTCLYYEVGNLAPIVLFVLIHLQMSTKPVQDADAHRAALNFLKRHGLGEQLTPFTADDLGHWGLTDRGRRWLHAMKQTALPIE